jgi:hypothetical protein
MLVLTLVGGGQHPVAVICTVIGLGGVGAFRGGAGLVALQKPLPRLARFTVTPVLVTAVTAVLHHFAGVSSEIAGLTIWALTVH